MALTASEQGRYFNAMALAGENAVTNPDYAAKLLGECPPDLRGREWYFLGNLVRREVRRIGDNRSRFDVAYNSDGTLLASAGDDKRVRVYDTRDFRLVADLAGHADTVSRIAFIAGTRRLVSAGFDKVAIVWDVPTGKEVARFTGHPHRIHLLAVSPDGSQVASGSPAAPGEESEILCLWDSNTGKLVKQVKRSIDWVNGPLHFLSDGKRLLLISGDDSIVAVDAATLEPIGEPFGQDALEVLGDEAREPVHFKWCAYSPKGDRIAVAIGPGNGPVQ